MRKALVLCLALAGTVVDPTTRTLVAPAEAAVSVAYTLEELVDTAPSAIVAKALERESRWEDVAGSRRIVTYTKLAIESPVYGEVGQTVWVRTLGGVVGKIGQHVAGEASFALNERALVFLAATRSGTLVVAGAAQGHFPIVEPRKEGERPTLRESPRLGKIVDRPGPRITVFERLVGKSLSDAVATIRATKAARDEAD